MYAEEAEVIPMFEFRPYAIGIDTARLYWEQKGIAYLTVGKDKIAGPSPLFDAVWKV